MSDVPSDTLNPGPWHGRDLESFGGLNVLTVAVPVAAVPSSAGAVAFLSSLAEHGLLPVVDDGQRLLGVLVDRDVLATDTTAFWAGERMRPLSALPVLGLRQTVAEARAYFQASELPLLPVCAEDGRYSGYCASRSEWLRLLEGSLRPPRLGGLATPLGVYMTTGVYASGAGLAGLLATGVGFALLIRLCDALFMVLKSAMAAVSPWAAQLDPVGTSIFQMAFTLVSLLALVRLTPLSGLHAAEHMTINAIENGVDLLGVDDARAESLVRSQPREHQRCGTNLMVLLLAIEAAWLSLWLMRDHLSPLGEIVYLAAWLFLVLRFAKPTGLWIQRHFTTKPPTPAELASGLKAGREILERFRRQPHPRPGLLRRLWGAGFVQIAGSFIVASMFVDWVLALLGRG